jgi:hypothetical protein
VSDPTGLVVLAMPEAKSHYYFLIFRCCWLMSEALLQVDVMLRFAVISLDSVIEMVLGEDVTLRETEGLGRLFH